MKGKSSGRPPTKPGALKNGFYLEIKNKGAASAVKLCCATKEEMEITMARYKKTKIVSYLGQMRNGKWVDVKKEEKKAAEEKKSAEAKKENAAKKEAAAKKETPVKKETVTKKETPAKKVAVAKKEVAAKKEAPVKKQAAAKKEPAAKKKSKG